LGFFFGWVVRAKKNDFGARGGSKKMKKTPATKFFETVGGLGFPEKNQNPGCKRGAPKPVLKGGTAQKKLWGLGGWWGGKWV